MLFHRQPSHLLNTENKCRFSFPLFQAYTSRVGEGPFPTELHGTEAEELILTSSDRFSFCISFNSSMNAAGSITMPNVYIAFLPGLLFGLGTMTMQVILGTVFGTWMSRKKNLTKEGIEYVARSISRNTLFYGGIETGIFRSIHHFLQASDPVFSAQCCSMQCTYVHHIQHI